jgi:hypothetical protein
MGTLWQDVKFGVRMLRKSRSFTIVAILTLALGIGANGAIFTIVNAFLFRPLPVPNADRLAVVAVQSGAQSIPAELSYRDYVDYRQQSDAFTDLAAYAINVTGLGTKGHADRIIASYVTSNYFSTLGVQPAVGRFFAAGEGDQPNSSPVVILGHHYWEQRFGGNPDVVGSAVNIDGRPVTIIGIVPKEFRGTFSIAEMDAYVPIGMIASGSENLALFTDRKLRQLRVIGALKPGLSVQAAQASLTVIAQRLASGQGAKHFRISRATRETFSGSGKNSASGSNGVSSAGGANPAAVLPECRQSGACQRSRATEGNGYPRRDGRQAPTFDSAGTDRNHSAGPRWRNSWGPAGKLVVPLIGIVARSR